MDNESISKILSRRINAMGLGKQYGAARVCAGADKVSDGQFEAVSFKNGVLKIRVDCGARAHLVKSREKEFITRVNDELKGQYVKKLVFEIMG